MPSTRSIARPSRPKPIISLPVSYQQRLDDVLRHGGDVSDFMRAFGAKELALHQRSGEFPYSEPSGDPALFNRFFAEKVAGRQYFTQTRLQDAITQVGNVIGDDSRPHVDLLENLPPEVKKAFADANVTLLGDHEYEFAVGSFKGGQYAPTFYDNLDWINSDSTVKGIMFSSGNAIQGVLYTAQKLMLRGDLRDDFSQIMVAYEDKLSPAKRARIEAFNEKKQGIVQIKDAGVLLQEFFGMIEDGDFDDFRDKMRADESKKMTCEWASFSKAPESLDPNDLDDLHVILEYYSWKNNLFHTPYSNTPGTIMGGAVMYHRIKEGAYLLAGADPKLASLMPNTTVSATTGRTGVAPHMIFMGLGGGSPGVGLAMAALFDVDEHCLVVGCMPADRPQTFIADSYQIPMIQSYGSLALKGFGSNRFQMADLFEDDIVRAFIDLNDAGYRVEPSGAIPLALAYMLVQDPGSRKKIEGKTLALVLSGGNFTDETMRKARQYHGQHNLGRKDYFTRP